MTTTHAGTHAGAGAPPYLRTVHRRSGLRRLWDRIGWNVALAIEILAIIVMAEVLISGFHIWNADFIPPPSDILDSFSRLAQRDVLFKNVAFSLGNFFVGYLLAVVVGVIFGLALGMFRTVHTMVGPLVWISYATPRSALAPLLVMWLGFGADSKVAVIFLFSVYPILVNVWTGAGSVDQTLVRAARIFGARRLDLYWKVVLPSIVPYLLIGLKLGISRGLVGVVIAEFIGSSAGIGYLIKILTSEFDMAGALALTLILVLTASVSMKILDLVRGRVAPWYHEDM